MATTKNPEAEKAAKQKKLLIILGVALLAVGAFQVPRLMGGKDKAAAPAAADGTTVSADGTTATPVAATPVATGTSAAATPLLPGEAGKSSPKATLVGVSIASGATVRATQGQLASFSLFEAKDPFEPQIDEKAAGPAETIAAKPAEGTTAAKPAEGATAAKPVETTPAAPETTPAKGATTPETTTPATPVTPVTPTTPETPATPVEPPRYATIEVNGVTESVEVEKEFPKDAPMFVLAKVKPGFVRIAIAGGALEKGGTAMVEVGTSITLVDAASGVRYVVRVLAVGTEPDLAFTSGATATTPVGVQPVSPTTTP